MPAKTALQLLVEKFVPSTDLLVLCKKDFDKYKEDVKLGLVPAVDADKILTLPSLSNSAVVKCGYGGWNYS